MTGNFWRNWSQFSPQADVRRPRLGLPDFVVADLPGIERVLPEIEGPEVESFFVYAEELRHSKRIAVLRDYLIKKVAESAF